MHIYIYIYRTSPAYSLVDLLIFAHIPLKKYLKNDSICMSGEDKC